LDSHKDPPHRICAFLKKWTREQFYEFQDDPQLLEVSKAWRWEAVGG
jgi:hypothetical protein